MHVKHGRRFYLTKPLAKNPSTKKTLYLYFLWSKHEKIQLNTKTNIKSFELRMAFDCALLKINIETPYLITAVALVGILRLDLAVHHRQDHQLSNGRLTPRQSGKYFLIKLIHS